MAEIPRDPELDGTLGILRDGYNFIWNRCQALQTDIFTTRMMGLPAVCIHGREAAEQFYDPAKCERAGALPRRVVTSLFGKHAVHTLDDERHRHRKAAFLSLMGRESLERLMVLTANQWRASLERWQSSDQVVLFDAVQELLTRSVCAWAGVPLHDHEVGKRARDLGSMVDAFGGVGPRLWKGKVARMRAERWVGEQVLATRRGRLHPAPDSALYVLANHRELDGSPLDLRTAAVEVLNVLRPTAAIAWYVTFAALALHEHPECKARIAREPSGEGAGDYTDLFMQEVRRFYPFTPYLGAKVRAPFAWRGHHFKPGALVLLDVHGTNHDPKIWEAPQQFVPERFAERGDDPFGFIPQGGGSLHGGHRCPGEWVTMHNIALALHFLTRCMSYDVAPNQDLSLDLRRMPTRPKSGLLIQRVQATSALDREAPRLPSLSAARAAAPAAARTDVVQSWP